jgi:hypothetical protein
MMKVCDPVYLALMLAFLAAIFSFHDGGRVEDAIVPKSEYEFVVVPP